MAEARVAVVTGANRGLGLEVVRQLAARGQRVVLGSRDLEKGRRAAEAVEGDVVVLACDVSDPRTGPAVAEEVRRRYGRCDILVNNAGIHYDRWQTASGADWRIVDEAFAVNFFGAWRLARHPRGSLEARDVVALRDLAVVVVIGTRPLRHHRDLRCIMHRTLDA